MTLRGNYRRDQGPEAGSAQPGAPDQPPLHYRSSATKDLQRPRTPTGPIQPLTPKRWMQTRGYRQMLDPDAPAAHYANPVERRELPAAKPMHRLARKEATGRLPWQQSTVVRPEDAVLLNRYGLTYRTAMLYPALFQASKSIFWKPLTDEQRAENTRMQAIAQERVGYERDAPKFFIKDFVPEGQAPNLRKRKNPEDYNPAEHEYEERRNKRLIKEKEKEQELHDRRKRRHAHLPAKAFESGNEMILNLPSVKAFMDLGGSPNSGRGGVLPTSEGGAFGTPYASTAGLPASYGQTPDPLADPLMLDLEMQALLKQFDARGVARILSGEVGLGMAFQEGMSDKELTPAGKKLLPKSGQSAAPVSAGEGPGGLGSSGTPPAPPPARPAVTPSGPASYSPAADAVEKYGTPMPREKVSRLDRGKIRTGGSRNKFGLTSRSEMNFPTAFQPIDASFWGGLTPEQQLALVRIQAIAMEKVGYEKSTTKYFIAGETEPVLNLPRPASETDPVALAAPRLVVGGLLLGMGGLSLGLALAGVLPQLALVSTAAAVSLVVGVLMVLNPRG